MKQLARKKKRSLGRILIVVLCTVLALTIAIYVVYVSDMRRIRNTIASQSQIIETRYGAVEFADWGSGPAVLVVHGAGGGYDQGKLIPQAFAAGNYRWISVSRFGYLRSAMPEDASAPAQAEAFADLLDALKIEKVAIIAMSGGVPPALQFAARYPGRTAAMALLSSAPYTPLTAGAQDLPIPAWLYQILFSSDFVFWVIVNIAPRRLDPVFNVSTLERQQLTENDLAFVSGLVDAFLPVTMRAAGLRNESAAIDPDTTYDLAAIHVPTLVIHAKDDEINPFSFGQFTARNIANAEFMPLENGGHLLLGHSDSIRARMGSFLAQHLNPGS